MRPEDEMVAEWLQKAEGDLQVAELILDTPTPVYWSAAFHAQQATEKFLKALLTFHGVEFERSHDIDYLLDLCGSVEPQTQELRFAGKLTEFAVESRYPFPRRDPMEEETRDALQIAKRVQRFVREKL